MCIRRFPKYQQTRNKVVEQRNAAPAPAAPAPKMRTIGRTSVRAGTTVSGQQTTSTAAPSRRRRQTARMGRRAGTRSLRISRNPNTGTGDLVY